MAKITIQHEFDLTEERDQLDMIINHQEIHYALMEYKEKLRANRKYSESRSLTHDEIEELFYHYFGDLL